MELKTAAKKPAGMKQTELGWIPEDWIAAAFGDVMTGFSSGQTPSRSNPEYYKGNIKWITSGELNYNVIYDTIEKITQEAVDSTHLKLIPAGTFLFAITGLEAEGTRGSCAISGVNATTNQSCMALYPNKEQLITDYLFHFYVHFGDWLALHYCQGTKQQSYTGALAKTLPIILPPTIEEQRAIATALSDTDELLAALDRLVEKKKAVKQATMQDLLSGKKRLPGFGGEWYYLKLEEECELITKGTTPTSLGKEYQNSGINFIKIESLDKNGSIIFSKTAFIDIATHELLQRSQLKENDLLFSIAGALGRVSIVRPEILPANTNQALAIIRLKKNSKIETGFLFHYLRSEKIITHINSINVQAAQANLSLENINAFEIFAPSLTEQTAIAQILSDMDAEIAALEKRRAKTAQIKQGMMQQLLTGKIRLI